jgi:hypothetical protein
MSVLLSLTVAFPLVCLAFLSLLGFVGIMALGGVMHMIVAAQARVGGTGASSLARSQSVSSGSHNPSIELVRPGDVETELIDRRPKAAPPPMYLQ